MPRSNLPRSTPPSPLCRVPRRGALLALVAVSAAAAGGLAGCPVVYPELATKLRKAPNDVALEPGPPADLRWIRFSSARIPPRTRDGRTWDQAFGKLPDPYAKLLINGKLVLRTPAQSNTLEPTWPDGPRGNFRIRPEDRLRVELWDSNPINDKPIGIRDVRPTEDHRAYRRMRVELEGGGEVELAFEPAHAMLGLGLWYELRTSSCHITRLLEGSPAERAGVQPGDEVLRLGERDVRTMSPADVRSAFNAIPSTGLPALLRHPNGATQTVLFVEGPIYPLYDEFGAVD